MDIYSVDKKNWFRVEQVFDEVTQYSSFLFEVYIDLGHSVFHSKNSDIQIFDINSFVNELNEFLMDRSLEPKLEGTYDSFLSFIGNNRDIQISFNIGSSYCSSETYSYSTSGKFEIDQEHLNEVLEFFMKTKSNV